MPSCYLHLYREAPELSEAVLGLLLVHYPQAMFAIYNKVYRVETCRKFLLFFYYMFESLVKQ